MRLGLPLSRALFPPLSVSDPLRSMQARNVHRLLWASAAAAAAFLLLHLVGLIALTPPQVRSVTVASGWLALLALWLQRWPAHYVAVAALLCATGWALFVQAQTQHAGNELRLIWHVLGLAFAYLLLGQRAGAAYVALTLATVWGINAHHAAPYSAHAMVVFSTALLLSAVCFHIFVAHSRALYRQLRAQEAHFRTLAEDTDELVWQVDADLRLRYISPSDQRLRGFSAGELLGRPVQELMPPEALAQLVRLERVTQGGGGLVTVPLRCKDGSERWFELSVRRRTAPDGALLGYHGIGRDVTQRHQLQAALAAHHDHLEDLVRERTAALSIAKEAAESATRAKSVFLSNMSHELRTPLTLILGMTELARAQAGTGRTAELLDDARRSAQALLALLQDLIDLADLEARRLTFDQRPFDLRTVMASVDRSVRPRMRAKGLALELPTPAQLPGPGFVGDAGRLEQLLLNLLDNAVKFSQRGTVQVQVDCVEQDTDHCRLRFAVVDQGEGIAPADQERIFALFEQGDGSTTRRHEGTGLGLALCRRLAEGMGGSMGVHSQPGEGSTFWFTTLLGRDRALLATDTRTGH